VTVTDANLVLGRLNPDYFLGGKMKLNPAKAQEKVAELGRNLGLNAAEAAQAISDMANENMANAIRLVSIERGLDARDFVLVAFGGAGPLHAGGIAEKMGMTRIVVPLYPGLCSAFGALIADLQVDKIWSKHFRSDSVEASTVNEQFQKLVTTALEELRAEGFSGTPAVERTISMRYAGQNYEHDVKVKEETINSRTLQQIFAEFHRLHEQFYGYAISEEIIEMIRFNVTVTGSTVKPMLKAISANGTPKPRQTRPVYFKNQDFIDCPIYHRDDLPSNCTLPGPAVVEGVDSTILLHPAHKLQVNDHGVISIFV
jgi:N-methylhydantoinase A